MGQILIMILLQVPADGSLDDALRRIGRDFGPPVVFIPLPKAPVAIDGNLDEDAWSSVRPLTLGHSWGGWDVPSQKTEARVLADGRAMYFAVRCFESHPEQMIAGGQAGQGVMKGDTVELFLDPGHREERGGYYHVMIDPKGTVSLGRGMESREGPTRVSVKVGRWEGGWTIEAAVPMEELGIVAGGVPKIWGFNICRQRPELGVVLPRAAAGRARFRPQKRKLDEPEKYREGELTSWAPTWGDHNYGDSCPFHAVRRFGHAALEAGTQDVSPPDRLIEVLFKSDFDSGDAGPFTNAAVVEESFRGPGKCLSTREGAKKTLYFTKPLEDLEDVTLLMTFKLPSNGILYYYGRAADSVQCGADRHEVFLTREEAEARAARGLFPGFDEYDTHADKMAWKAWGRLWKAPGTWTLMTGYFCEPSLGHVLSPGKDWAILRTRLGFLRRYPGTLPRPAQRLVPATQGYPRGLVFHATGPLLIDDFVVFRGTDVEPPSRVVGVAANAREGQVELTWEASSDNTLTAYYRIYAGDRLAGEAHRLSASFKEEDVAGVPLRVVAGDLYGNLSEPSAEVRVAKKGASR